MMNSILTIIDLDGLSQDAWKSLKKENTIPWKINNLTRETKFKPAKFGFHWQTQYELHKTRNCTTRAGIWIQSANNVYAWNQKWKILKEQVWLG